MEEQGPEKPEIQIRRILVALDASWRSLEALEGVVELASRLRADLEGLFVEDADLLRLAAAASATRFLFPTASEEPLSGSHMERELKALAEGARRELARMAGESRVRWSFRIVRGRLPAEILSAAGEADLISLSLGGAAWVKGAGFRFGSAPRASRGTPPSFLQVRLPSLKASPVLVVYEGSQGAEDALRLAAQVAEAYGSRLTVLLPSPSGHLSAEMEAEVLHLLAGAHLQFRCRAIDPGDPLDFMRAVRAEEGGVLVLRAGSAFLDEATVQILMRETGKSLLIVSGRPGPGGRTSTTAPHSEKT